MTKSIKLPAALLSGIIIGAVAFTAIGTSAHQNSLKGDYSKEQWQALSDEEKTALKEEKMAERQDKFEEKLQTKVDEGLITADQQSAILDRMNEKIQEKLNNSEDRLTKEQWQALSDEEKTALKEEKMAEREQRKAEAQEFFDSIGLDKEDFFEGRGHGKKGHHGGKHFQQTDNAADIAPVSIQ